MVPRTHADGEALVAVEAGVAENKVSLLPEVGRAGPQCRLHDHLHGDPGRPVGALHVAAAATRLKARIDLGSAITLPGPMPRHGFEIDGADHRPCPDGVIRYLPGEIERIVQI